MRANEPQGCDRRAVREGGEEAPQAVRPRRAGGMGGPRPQGRLHGIFSGRRRTKHEARARAVRVR